MIKVLIYAITFFFIIPLISCRDSQKQSFEIVNKSYINNFELLQDNSKSETTISINSPRAIIDTLTNDIEIFDSLIHIYNDRGNNIQLKSGNSSLENTNNIIRVYNNVHISLLDTKDSYIKTDELIWDLNISQINLNNPLLINFKNTTITSSKGIYNIDSSILNLINNNFNRDIYNNDGKKLYKIHILSDNARWYKYDNSLEFSSNQKQVETTINFLRIK